MVGCPIRAPRLCPRHSWSVRAWTGRLPAMTASRPSRVAAGRPRALGRARRQRARHRRRRRGRRARPGRRRRPLPRLRRRHRLPEPRPQPRGGRPGDPRTGRPVPAPVLHGRGLRALRRCLPQARELSPCRGADQKTILFNSGAEAVKNAVKIARAKTGRPAIVSLRPRLPRAHADDDDADRKVKPYKRASDRSRPRCTARPRRIPTGGSSDDCSRRSSNSSWPTSTPRPSRP